MGPDLAVINLVLLKKGEKEVPGLTDTDIARRLGPKRANNIRKLFVRGPLPAGFARPPLPSFPLSPRVCVCLPHRT